MDKQKADVVAMVRGCLISSKGEMTLRELHKDYMTLCGEHIPYKKLGFNSLEHMLKSEPTFMLRQNGADILVRAQLNDKSSHIREMVLKQKGTKKRPTYNNTANNQYQKGFFKPQHISPPQPRPAPQFYQQQPQHQPQQQTFAAPFRWRPKGVNDHWRADNYKVNFGKVESTMAKKHSQFIETSPRKTTPPPPKVTPEPKKAKQALTFQPTGNCADDIRQFARVNALGEVVASFTEINSGKKDKFYTCKLTLGKFQYYSYPEEFAHQAQAESYCAQKALEDLVPKFEKSSASSISQSKDVLERVPPMLRKHFNGLWAAQLEMDYLDKWGEKLPSDWLDLCRDSDSIQIEECHGKSVLRYCTPGEKHRKWDTSQVTDISVPTSTIILDESQKLTAKITKIRSVNEIWCQQIDQKQNFERFVKQQFEMEKFYKLNQSIPKLRAESVRVGEFYVVHHNNKWLRIRVENQQQNQYQCFLIDFGDQIWVDKSALYVLKREFAASNAQAFVCRLQDLEEFAVISEDCPRLLEYQQQFVVLKCEKSSAPGEVAVVQMYCPSTGDCINEKLQRFYTVKSGAFDVVKDQVLEVFVSNIEGNGDIYIQLPSKGFDALGEVLANLTDVPGPCIVPNKANCCNKIFLARYKLDGMFYRVKILDWAPQGKYAQIYFVDYGNTDIINTETDLLYPLEAINSELLLLLPEQAIKVRMNLKGVEVGDDFVALCKRLLPEEDAILMKVLDLVDGSPLVELFRRSPELGLLCVNKSIEMEAELNNNRGTTGRFA